MTVARASTLCMVDITITMLESTSPQTLLSGAPAAGGHRAATGALGVVVVGTGQADSRQTIPRSSPGPRVPLASSSREGVLRRFEVVLVGQAFVDVGTASPAGDSLGVPDVIPAGPLTRATPAALDQSSHNGPSVPGASGPSLQTMRVERRGTT